ncbi:MAG TPA: N-acyl homoserine lactonase family protein [Gemmatimonadaceae bacterium]|nr:N-acyl homoserine lactonase family protein [Gemmatimonadaceae bacterium]
MHRLRQWYASLPRIRSLRAAAVLLPLTLTASIAFRGAPPTYEVYAIRYATIPNFRVASLVAGADTSRRMDIAMMVWLLEGSDGRKVLVDAGFHRDDFVRRWHPADYMTPSEAVSRLGVRPDDISDVIISHVHWDHLDGIDLFPKARVWLQREEFEHHLDSAGTVKDRAIDAGDAKVLADIARQGRLMLIDGDGKEILTGITVYTGGKHTFASQYASVRSAAGMVVVASDNAYLYENLAKHAPIAQTLDSVSNLAAQRRMLSIASNPRLIVPGHDPGVFDRFPTPGKGIALIH